MTLSDFPGFERLYQGTPSAAFRGVVGGQGPAVLLLHGYPQTHLAWRRIAPELAQRYRVVVPDLPGYGASRQLDQECRWTKRRVAAALLELMDALGLETFAVVGHDRGARVGYRLALDHPARVERYASLTVVPTPEAWASFDRARGLANFHWTFLAQPSDLPERLLAADPDAFLEQALARMAGGLDRVEPHALAAYREAFRDPAVRHAICENYRAGADEDLADDLADQVRGQRLDCPLLVLWSAAQVTGEPPTAIWRRWARDVRGKALPGGHLQPEECAAEVLAALVPFLAGRPEAGGNTSFAGEET
ncbi:MULTISPECIES: alpha/beta fold hydrolase [Pseudomonas]|uniref:Haloacetate dehalogenase n=1 Tax=Pseudomonas oryzihabitans TaxID=47885 RepID=A0A1G5PFE2_9PSED|nr:MULTISPECIES: alpha/beta hydrolase [Pseudomonas]KXJ33199.1 hydrolase [Pseudomonas sp. HUK17]NMY92502.1 alpha/beta hydrolase [Pseudomonas psychrotolerans]SCZ48263.1 haloacetate dehalogenase [Pseudomonas psychrotolerans]